MSDYVSIKEEVLQKLEANMPVIQERFGIEKIGIFGSVSRGTDTPDSDIDIIYQFKPGIRMYHNLLDLGDFLEELFGRNVDLIAIEWVSPYLKSTISQDTIYVASANIGAV